MPIFKRASSSTSRQYPLSSAQLYLLISDFSGHYQRIIPGIISKSTYRVSGGPNLDTIVIEAAVFEEGSTRQVRSSVQVIEPGRAFRITEDDLSRWMEYRVRPVSAGESILELSWPQTTRSSIPGWIRQYLFSDSSDRTAREILDNIDQYRQTLGSTILATTSLVTPADVDRHD